MQHRGMRSPILLVDALVNHSKGQDNHCRKKRVSILFGSLVNAKNMTSRVRFELGLLAELTDAKGWAIDAFKSKADHLFFTSCLSVIERRSHH